MKVYFNGNEINVVLEHKDLDKIMHDIRFYGGFAYYEFRKPINEVLRENHLKDKIDLLEEIEK